MSKKQIYDIDTSVVHFSAQTVGFDVGNAHYLAAASALAYENEPVIRKQIKSWGFDKFNFIDKGSTQAFVSANDEILWIVFRGTQAKQFSDIKTDLEFGLSDNPWGKTHYGFTESLESVWESELIPVLNEFYNGKQTIWVAGHSLGAAVACLCAARLEQEQKDKSVHGVYTFGQPRTGNLSFARKFNAVFTNRNCRFVNNNDIVARVPPAGLLLKYWHVNKMIYIDSKHLLRPGMPLWRRVFDEVRGIVTHGGLDAFKDHQISNYITALKKSENHQYKVR